MFEAGNFNLERLKVGKMADIDILLNEVSLISKKYEEIAKITGNNFNIFKILAVETKETSHSRILTDILNPSGSHDCGYIFLKLFFKKFLSDVNENIDFSKCSVYREYSTDLGQIDIFIDCQNFGIVIENKIYAGDQPKQLKRYNDFLAKRFKEKSFIFYLTLYGDEASEQSHGSIDYKCLSYKNDILKWLEFCQKEVYNKALIRETLEQYKNVIKFLTGQTGSSKMSEDIVNAITKNAESIESAIEISNNLLKAKLWLFTEKLKEPLVQIAKDYNIREVSEIWDQSVKEGWYCIAFKKPAWEQSYIRFQTHSNYRLDKLLYGLVVNISKSEISEERLNEMINAGFKRFQDKQDSNTFYLSKDIDDWSESSFMELCTPSNDTLKSFENKIKELAEILQTMECS